MEKLMFNDLKNKVCVITGGSGIIGSSLAEGLASVGAKIAIIGRSEEKAEIIAKLLREKFHIKAIGVSSDVTDKESLKKAKNVINNSLGKINFLINCAGGNSPKATTKQEFLTEEKINSFEETFFGLELEGFRQVFDLNFIGTLLPTMVFATDMIEKKCGAIINISSMNAFKPLTKIPAYSAAKASINNFTEWLSTHFAKVGVRVNAIAPGFFLTEQNRFLLIDETTGSATQRGQKIISNTPMGRYGEPKELQGTALYLLSNLSSFVTGIVIPVDGGFNAYSGV